MMRVARNKARSCGRKVRFLSQDIRRLRFEPASFDLVTCIYDSLNYLTESADLARAFRGVSKALRHRGLFIFDMNTAFAFQQQLFTQEHTASDPVRYRWLSSYDADSRICRVDMEFWTDDGKHFREVHFQRAYSNEEIENILEQASLKLLACHQAYTMLPAGKQSDRVFYVASNSRRPDAHIASRRHPLHRARSS
jgi:SAM-dependent methyltransferase